ncbi:MAG: hypothetical protein AB1656_06125 [Candidatus Omnitrophota bacterium]
MKIFSVILSVLFIASPFAMSQVYELEYMIEVFIEPGNPHVQSNIDMLKSPGSDDISVKDFIKYLENKYLNGETIRYPYTIKVSFSNSKPYCYVVKDFAPPIQNAIFFHKTHSPYLFNVICDDGKNERTEMKFNYPRDDNDGNYHATEMPEFVTTKFLYAYDYLVEGLTIFRDNKNNPFYSVIHAGRKLMIKISDKDDVSQKSNKSEKIDLIFDQDDHDNFILKSYIINGPQGKHEFTLKEMKIKENYDPKKIETWNN